MENYKKFFAKGFYFYKKYNIMDILKKQLARRYKIMPKRNNNKRSKRPTPRKTNKVENVDKKNIDNKENNKENKKGNRKFSRIL